MDLIITLLRMLFLPIAFLVGRAVERKHIRSLDEREARHRDMVVVTNLRKCPATWAVTHAAYVDGQAVIASDYWKSFAASWRNFFGGEMRSLEPLLMRARREAIARMTEEARLQGATVVVNVRLETSSIVRGSRSRGRMAAEVHAYGTALRVANS